MGKVDQSKVKSGFDAEALLGERYLQIVFQTAFDAGLIPAESDFDGKKVIVAMLGSNDRLYEPTLGFDGFERSTHRDSFVTTILFNDPRGANLKVRLMIGTDTVPPVAFDLILKTELEKVFDELGGIASVGMKLEVIDIESLGFDALEDLFDITKDVVMEKVKVFVNRTIDLGGASKFKRVEDLAIRFHEADADHPAALGIYVNVRIRNGDDEDAFLPARGDVNAAINFLPNDEDIAMATRPGMYGQMAKDIFSRTAIPLENGGFEHAFRKNLLDPKSKRLGDMHGARVGQIPPLPGSGNPLPQNGLRINVDGDFRDPIDLTNTDVTLTVDLRPRINDDGFLVWNTDLDVNVDALFEFIGLWAAILVGIAFGAAGVGLFVAGVLVAEVITGLIIAEVKDDRVASKADATLADVIPDRLTIKTRRWDPFYATLHQVVTKPSQAEFNAVGFMLCGKAFVGRELVPPMDTVIRDETRDANGAINGLRYRILDHEVVKEDVKIDAPGTHRREFVLANDAEPELWGLSLDAIKARVEDPDGPLVLTNIPYFQASVFIRENQIDQILCISGVEIDEIQLTIRDETSAAIYARISAEKGAEITQAIKDEFEADGVVPTQEQIDTELDVRISKETRAELLRTYSNPTPLELALSGKLQPHLKFDLAPEELLMLRDRRIVLIDPAIKAIDGKKVVDYLRDHGGFADGKEDNLLERPKYKPTPEGPVFR